MKTLNLSWKTLTAAVMLPALLQSCKKENGIDNNNVLKRPYVVYAADVNGNILKTNDGDTFKTVFSGDGKPLRTLIVAGENMMLCKDNQLFLSTNEGQSFAALVPGKVDIERTIRWHNFIIYTKKKALFLTSWAGDQTKNGYVVVNYKDLIDRYFTPDTLWKTFARPNLITSFAELDNGVLFGWSNGGGPNGDYLLYQKVDTGKEWSPVSTNLEKDTSYYITHIGNTLVATDYNGGKGAWYSVDSGKHFKQYLGLPTDVQLPATAAAFDRVIVGTAGKGVYVFQNSGRFEPSNSGLDANTSVYSIVAKENVFKNDNTAGYIYIATNTGLYRSKDLAKTWIKVRPGSYNIVY